MDDHILAQCIVFEEQEVLQQFEKTVDQSLLRSAKLIYYPYYFFHYALYAKRLWHPIMEYVGCTVEAISGRGALIDALPKFFEVEASLKQIVPPSISLHNATAVAESFLYHSISLKFKVLSTPKIEMKKSQLFYRPYWVVQTAEQTDLPNFIVDAVSGKYHPL